jgi:hypothetical protein
VPRPISTIETHPDSAKIINDLIRGVPVRTVCKRYDCSMFACYRYLKRKVPQQLKAAHNLRKIRCGDDLEKLRIDASNNLLSTLMI